MKNRLLSAMVHKPENVIALFGGARLVRQPDGAVELRGGEPRDRTAAKEWVSLFMHEAVVRLGGETPRGSHQIDRLRGFSGAR